MECEEIIVFSRHFIDQIGSDLKFLIDEGDLRAGDFSLSSIEDCN